MLRVAEAAALSRMVLVVRVDRVAAVVVVTRMEAMVPTA